MKKLLTIMILLCALQAHAVELDTQQKTQAQRLTDISLSILDLSKVLKDTDPLKNIPKSLLEENKSCLKHHLTTREGYHQYQLERAQRYVVSRTPQQLQQDFEVLNHDTIQILGGLFDDVLKSKQYGVDETKFKQQATKNLLEYPEKLEKIMILLTDPAFRDLRVLLQLNGFDDPNNAHQIGKLMAVQYFLWSLNQCHISLKNE